MNNIILRIYDYLNAHRTLCWTVLGTLTAVMALLASRLTYKEDISDFLSVSSEDRKHLNIYQSVSGADRLMIVFEQAEPDSICAAIDDFCADLQQRDTAHTAADMTAEINMETIHEVQRFVYQHIPLFLTQEDYQRMDSLLAQPEYISRQLQRDKEMLLFPSGGLLSGNISRDPLNLFTPTAARLQRDTQPFQFENYNGYIFTPDMKKAFVTIRSPYGNAETEQNACLISMLEQSVNSAAANHPTVKAHITGGPQIAVGNAQQIKRDSTIAVALAVALILALLVWWLRSWKGILLIALSIGWGLVWALGIMSMFTDSVSIIVIGISSVILGIAANYPLHLITHSQHEPDMRLTLSDIASPLLIGNITTVGAFLALIPLRSIALRDLGMFASLLLIGTIVFVLIFLPQMIRSRRTTTQEQQPQVQQNLTIPTSQSLKTSKYKHRKTLYAAVAILTLFFGYFALNTEFDANIANINYITAEERADMDYLQQLQAENKQQGQQVYIVSDKPDADSTLTRFMPTQETQQARILRWQQFVNQHRTALTSTLQAEAAKQGFSPQAFEEFLCIIQTAVEPLDLKQSVLSQTVFSQNLYEDKASHKLLYVTKRNASEEELKEIKRDFPDSFSVESMNATMANSLTDNFNYIGAACSAIVFFFLWFSFRKFWLAVIAFVPMAISWVWILGIMSLLGIKFNIVNIILATFIFGQGDDYTIFITEGCLHEHETGRPVLASHRRSIILSALIMLIGIGALITARHPALFSLAEVTIIGMGCVSFMAMLIPPLLFKVWLSMRNQP